MLSHTSDNQPALRFGQWVEISGRTMLRPGFSLVGLTGIIFPTASNAPAGSATVAVDWERHGYTEANGYPPGALPLWVNVPVMHLVLIEPGPPPLPEEEPEDEPPPPERPKLRLI